MYLHTANRSSSRAETLSWHSLRSTLAWLSCASLLALAACGGGGGDTITGSSSSSSGSSSGGNSGSSADGGSSSNTTTSVSFYYVKAPVNGAQCSLRTPGTTTVVAGPVTSANGRGTITATNLASGWYAVTCVGGSFNDEVVGNKNAATARAAVNITGTSARVVISPLTELAYQLAESNLSGSYATASANIARTFGLLSPSNNSTPVDINTVEPTDMSSQSAVAANTAQARYGAVLAGLAQYSADNDTIASDAALTASLANATRGCLTATQCLSQTTGKSIVTSMAKYDTNNANVDNVMPALITNMGFTPNTTTPTTATPTVTDMSISSSNTNGSSSASFLTGSNTIVTVTGTNLTNATFSATGKDTAGNDKSGVISSCTTTSTSATQIVASCSVGSASNLPANVLVSLTQTSTNTTVYSKLWNVTDNPTVISITSIVLNTAETPTAYYGTPNASFIVTGNGITNPTYTISSTNPAASAACSLQGAVTFGGFKMTCPLTNNRDISSQTITVKVGTVTKTATVNLVEPSVTFKTIDPARVPQGVSSTFTISGSGLSSKMSLLIKTSSPVNKTFTLPLSASDDATTATATGMIDALSTSDVVATASIQTSSTTLSPTVSNNSITLTAAGDRATPPTVTNGPTVTPSTATIGKTGIQFTVKNFSDLIGRSFQATLGGYACTSAQTSAGDTSAILVTCDVNSALSPGNANLVVQYNTGTAYQTLSTNTVTLYDNRLTQAQFTIKNLDGGTDYVATVSPSATGSVNLPYCTLDVTQDPASGNNGYLVGVKPTLTYRSSDATVQFQSNGSAANNSFTAGSTYNYLPGNNLTFKLTSLAADQDVKTYTFAFQGQTPTLTVDSSLTQNSPHYVRFNYSMSQTDACGSTRRYLFIASSVDSTTDFTAYYLYNGKTAASPYVQSSTARSFYVPQASGTSTGRMGMLFLDAQTFTPAFTTSATVNNPAADARAALSAGTNYYVYATPYAKRFDNTTKLSKLATLKTATSYPAVCSFANKYNAEDSPFIGNASNMYLGSAVNGGNNYLYVPLAFCTSTVSTGYFTNASVNTPTVTFGGANWVTGSGSTADPQVAAGTMILFKPASQFTPGSVAPDSYGVGYVTGSGKLSITEGATSGTPASTKVHALQYTAPATSEDAYIQSDTTDLFDK